jgi:Ca2+-binding RTX toxin-like protein
VNFIASPFDDNIIGSNGVDNIYGMNGNDVLEGLGGADVLNGGSGVDTASYSSCSTAVIVSLLENIAMSILKKFKINKIFF